MSNTRKCYFLKKSFASHLYKNILGCLEFQLSTNTEKVEHTFSLKKITIKPILSSLLLILG